MIATILLLALTVVLFSSIFAFVTSFPSPPAQNTSQFTANMVLTKNQTYVAGIQITHLAGPSIPGSSLVYFKSATHPNAPEFQNPIKASVGLGGAATWNLGQTFNYTFIASQQPLLPDNISVLVVASNQLVFATVLPGQTINVPPSFTSTGITPGGPAIGAGFTIFAVAAGNLGAASVYVNVASIPGLATTFPGPQKMTYSAVTNQWTFAVPAGLTTSGGTFFAFVNVTGALSQTATSAVTVVVGGSGGSSAGLFSVAVVSPPPTLPQTSVYFAAVIRYSGLTANVPVAVSFWAVQTPLSTPAGKFATVNQTFTAAPGLKISGPSSLTVFSSSAFSGWLFNSSIVVTASATLTGVGTGNGTTNYTSANLIHGIVFSTSTAFSHSCAGASCPWLNLTVTNNGNFSVLFAGHVWANSSGSTSYTVASTTVTAGSSVTLSAPGAGVRWHPTTAGTYSITMRLVVTVSSGAVVGYIYATFPPVTVT